MAQQENRVDKYVSHWEKKNNPSGNRAFLNRRLEFLDKIASLFTNRGDLSDREKKSLEKVRREARWLQQRLRPSMLERFLQNFRSPLSLFLHAFMKNMRETINEAREKAAAGMSRKADGQQSGNGRDTPPKVRTAEGAGQVRRKLEDKGFGKVNLDGMADAAMRGKDGFQVDKSFQFAEGELAYTVQFNKSGLGVHHPAAVEATLKKPVEIEKAVYGGVDTADLENRMRQVDWSRDYGDKGVTLSANRVEHLEKLAQVDGIFKDLLTLLGSGAAAKEAYDKLGYKYFDGTPSQRLVRDMQQIKARYETTVKQEIDPMELEFFTPRQMVNLMEGRAVRGGANPDDSAAWYKMDWGDGGRSAGPAIKRATGPQPFDTAQALQDQGMRNAPGIQNVRQIERLIENGEKVEAAIHDHGIEIRRVVSYDPVARKLVQDLAESEKKNLFEPSPANLRAGYEALRTRSALTARQAAANGKIETAEALAPEGMGKSPRSRKNH